MLPNTKLIRKYLVKSPTSLTFISIQNKDLENNIINKPLGLATIKLFGNYYEKLEVVQLLELELDRAKLIRNIFAILPIVKFDTVFIDKDNYLIFNSDRLYNNMARSFDYSEIASQKEDPLKAPSLKAVIRPENIIYRQKEVLDPILNTTLFYANNISEMYKAMSQRIGQNPLADALAGACEQGIKLQHSIYASIATQQNSNIRNYITING